MYRLGINFDEISNDLDLSISLMKRCGIQHGELRTIGGKNFALWTDAEVDRFRNALAKTGIDLVGAATPLFKWYTNEDDPEVPHDNHGFNPRLSYKQKVQIIERTFEIASKLSIPRLRIFSGLGKVEDPVPEFLEDPLFEMITALAEQYRIQVYLENEPVCKIFTKEHLEKLFRVKRTPWLKLWLDVANIVELGQEVDTEFIRNVSQHIGYVHVKDFITNKGEKEYVVLGHGIVPYEHIISDIDKQVKGEVVFTIETHAKKNKEDSSRRSLENMKSLLDKLKINYD